MTDLMQPFAVLSSLINGLVLDAVNENALYCSVPFYALEEEHIHEAYEALLEQFPNMYLAWESERGWYDFELKENETYLLHKKDSMQRELTRLLNKEDELLKKIQILEKDIAALNAIEQADDLLRRLS